MWCKIHIWVKNRNGNVFFLYFHRNDTYCIIINNEIKDIFTLKAVRRGAGGLIRP